MAIQENFGGKQQRHWTPRDLYILTLLSQQRALSLDHLPRFLALFEGKWGTEQCANLKSTTHNLVERLQHAGLIQQQQLGKCTSGWISLTKTGMQFLGLPSSSWKRPARSTLPTLHAANSIRLHLTERDSQVSWLSQHQLRSEDVARMPHLFPTAEFQTERGERIAIHVVLRLTGTEEQIMNRMLQQLEQKTHLGEQYSALWYYATTEAATRLRTASARISASVTKKAATEICIFSYPLIHKHVLYRGHRAPIQTLAWSRDGKQIASADKSGILHIWDAVSGKEHAHHVLPIRPLIIDWSSKEAWIVLGDKDGKLSLWEGATNNLYTTTINYTEKTTYLAWSPLTNNVVVSCSVQDQLWMYGLRQNALQWESQRYQGVEVLAWSPDGNRLAVGGNDTCVRLLNAKTGKHVQTYKKHSSTVQSVAWSPCSQWLASASQENSILIWDATSGKKRRTIWSRLNRIGVLSWSPDGKMLACTGSEAYVQVWDITTGRLLQTYADHAHEITSITWSLDSAILASVSSNTVHIYPVLRGS